MAHVEGTFSARHEHVEPEGASGAGLLIVVRQEPMQSQALHGREVQTIEGSAVGFPTRRKNLAFRQLNDLRRVVRRLERRRFQDGRQRLASESATVARNGSSCLATRDLDERFDSRQG
jgi:hypothetical protein